MLSWRHQAAASISRQNVAKKRHGKAYQWHGSKRQRGGINSGMAASNGVAKSKRQYAYGICA